GDLAPDLRLAPLGQRRPAHRPGAPVHHADNLVLPIRTILGPDCWQVIAKSETIRVVCVMADRAPTIYDVARAAGVAASTVSRAFSRPGRVHAETAERIRRIAQDLGYHAHPIARAGSAGRTS